MPFFPTRVITTCLIACILIIAPSQSVLADPSVPEVESQEGTSSKESIPHNTAQGEPEIKAAVKVSQNIYEDKVTITKDILPLRSRLRKKYTGYNITLHNDSDIPLEVVSANIVSGINGQQAYTTVKKGSGGAIAGILGGGLLVGLVTFGAGFVVSLIVAPIVGGIKRSKNKKAQREGLPFTNQVPLGIFNPGETFTTATLVPLGTQAHLEATLRNTKTDELFTISK